MTIKDNHLLLERLRESLGSVIVDCAERRDEVELVVPAEHLPSVCRDLRDKPGLAFAQLIDLAGVDYLEYGVSEWVTEDSGQIGFSRGVDRQSFARFSFADPPSLRHTSQPRFAVVCQLLSLTHNWRLRVKAFCADDDFPSMPSLIAVWRCADWYEREAFDLFGIVFEGHPDLRRLLTDYGFIGHPFRKDFPLVGHVEMRYDPEQGRVVYQPVSIQPRVLVPKVQRADHRYLRTEG